MRDRTMITVPLGEVAGQIRESIRQVLASHRFVIVDDEGPHDVHRAQLGAERFEQLLRELGNNAAMTLVALDYERQADAEERAAGARASGDPDEACAACGHERVFHQIGTGSGVPVGVEFCDDRHAPPCDCRGFRPMDADLAERNRIARWLESRATAVTADGFEIACAIRRGDHLPRPR